MPDFIVEGLTATVIGMGMVFGVLAILCVILYFFKYLTPQAPVKKSVPEPETVNEQSDKTEDEYEYDTEAYAADTQNVSNDSELIAVISAAVAACLGEGARIAAITPVKPEGAKRSAYKGWTAAAIRENHRGLY